MINPEIFVQMALQAWNVHVRRADQFFDSFADEALLKEVAPGKNRVSYLLGHLVAVNDNMIGLFGLGQRSYSHLDEAFLKNADRSGLAVPEPSELRSSWKKSKEELTGYFSKMSVDDWFSKHSAVSDEDFAKEPTRNKLNVLLNRTNHLAYHLGQLVLAK